MMRPTETRSAWRRGAALAAVFFLVGAVRLRAAMDDRIPIYDMKEDPSLNAFLGHNEPIGFYGLEIDEDRAAAAILYRSGDVLFRREVDLRVRGNKLLLKNGKRRKTLIREQHTTPSGAVETVIYPPECPPDQGGWRRGASFGHHLINRKDDEARRLVVGAAHLDYESAVSRCGGQLGDCGPSGCDAWAAAVSSATGGAGASASSQTIVHPPLFQALRDGSMNYGDLAYYEKEIDDVLPATLRDLSATTTSYNTTPYPFPGLLDTSIQQKGLRIGTISKTYTSPNLKSPVVIGIEPLLDAYKQPPLKCGMWEDRPNRSQFTVGDHPALYTQTPATEAAPATSSLYVCGENVSVSVETNSDVPRSDLSALVEALPMAQIEKTAAPPKK